MANQNQDRKIVSNQIHEIRSAAKAMKTSPIFIHLAKYKTGSNDRETIKNWINTNKEFIDFIKNK